MTDKLDAIPGSTGRKIIDGLKDAVAGNFSAVLIEGQRWVRADAPCTREPGAPLPSDETRPAVDKVRTMVAMGINIQGNGAVINGIVTGILEGMLAHVDELEADLKCAIAVGQMAAKQGQQSAASTDTLVKVLQEIGEIADRPIHGTSLQTKADRFRLIKMKVRDALADPRNQGVGGGPRS